MKTKTKKIDANDIPQEVFHETIENIPSKTAEELGMVKPVSVEDDGKVDDLPLFHKAVDMKKDYPEMRKPLITGLLRQGETMNVIAAPKAGKSWLVTQMALSVAAGIPWFNYPTEKGKVLIIDNELHNETISERVPLVAEKMRLGDEVWGENLYINAVRGNLTSIRKMDSYFNKIKDEGFKLIILDAFYRFMPEGMDENDNGAMADVYNTLDRYADALKTSFVLIHHTTKGNQAGKSVTDVGAGAGSQSRAADCHLVLLPHEENNAVTVDAVTRSWRQPEKFVISKDEDGIPFWRVNGDLDPDMTQGNAVKEPKEICSFQDFIEQFICDEPKTREFIHIKAEAAGLTVRLVKGYLTSINQGNDEFGMVYHWKTNKPLTHWYSMKEPEGGAKNYDEKTKKDLILEEIKNDPDIGVQYLCDSYKVTRQYIYQIRRSEQGTL